MSKDELICHIETVHGWKVGDKSRTAPLAELAESHMLIHRHEQLTAAARRLEGCDPMPPGQGVNSPPQTLPSGA